MGDLLQELAVGQIRLTLLYVNSVSTTIDFADRSLHNFVQLPLPIFCTYLCGPERQLTRSWQNWRYVNPQVITCDVSPLRANVRELTNRFCQFEKDIRIQERRAIFTEKSVRKCIRGKAPLLFAATPGHFP